MSTPPPTDRHYSPSKPSRPTPPRLTVAGSLRELPAEQTWITLKDGSMYKGQWLDGYPHGQGERWSGKEQYTGAWAKGKQEGKGRQMWQDGRVYEGEFKQGLLDGHGRLEWQSTTGRAVYEGDFSKNLRHGRGKYTWDDGRTYDGEWRAGKRHGEAVCTDRHGNEKRGMWDDDKLQRWCEEVPESLPQPADDVTVSGGILRRSCVLAVSYLTLFFAYWLGSRRYDEHAGEWDFQPDDLQLLFRGGLRSLQPNFELPGPRHSAAQEDGSQGSDTTATAFSITTPSLQGFPLWPMTPIMANFRQPSMRAGTPSKQQLQLSPGNPQHHAGPPVSSLGSNATSRSGALWSSTPSSAKLQASPRFAPVTSNSTAMSAAGVGDDVHHPPVTLLGAACTSDPKMSATSGVILFCDEEDDDLGELPKLHNNNNHLNNGHVHGGLGNTHGNGNGHSHQNGNGLKEAFKPAPLVYGIDEQSLEGSPKIPPKSVPRRQRFPIFIIVQTVFTFMLWFIFAIKEAAEGTPFNLAVAGFDTMAPHSFDLRVSRDCEDMRWQLWRWWTYQFTHVGTQHILAKCCLNVLYGVPLEGVLGTSILAALYNIGILGGACLSLINDAHAPVVGMSAGCYAMLGIHLVDVTFNWSSRHFQKATITLFALATFLDLLFVYTTSEEVTHTIEGATFGGFITGTLTGIVLSTSSRADSWERALRRAAIALGVLLSLACFIWSMSKWPPQDLWEKKVGAGRDKFSALRYLGSVGNAFDVQVTLALPDGPRR
eukprot:CAMPEP_0178454220 /NCGR_PEP_ID=MMETSP0689_2-20121128/45236_1 /TAXON_ID=160604 /ORGANISM="Amphidinium massartii, Strain CS-259" /LENGTH=765 /DNA_ID=CAMNT_0020080127 /DNA_START=22 /DNA_END=2317 /DNA_ORIENTATION=-